MKGHFRTKCRVGNTEEFRIRVRQIISLTYLDSDCPRRGHVIRCGGISFLGRNGERDPLDSLELALPLELFA